MYKYQAEALAAKWQKAKKYPPSLFGLIFSGLSTLLIIYYEISTGLMLLGGLAFVVDFMRYLYIDPLLSKVDLLEAEVTRLKKAADIEDEPLY